MSVAGTSLLWVNQHTAQEAAPLELACTGCKAAHRTIHTCRPALNPDEIVTAIVCDGCDGDFELPPGVPVPDGEWYCAACCVGEREGAPKPVQAVAEGLQLHLSSSSRTGYTGVSLHRASRRFHAFRREGCKSVYIGTYCTAVEAAVAYARAAEQAGAGFAEPAELPSSSVDSPRAAEQVRAGFAEAPSVAASVAQEAEGLRLHLSSTNSTGYTGVSWTGSRFAVEIKLNGRRVHLGTFDTAVEAAVAYARAGGEAPAVVADAGGVRLHLSSRNPTGYRGVTKGCGRFRVEIKLNGRRVHLGTFDTAVEAAVAYARAGGEGLTPASRGKGTKRPRELGCFCGTDRHLPTNNLPFEGVWISCDACGRWCHGECAGVDKQQAEEAEEYTEAGSMPPPEYTCPLCAATDQSAGASSDGGSPLIVAAVVSDGDGSDDDDSADGAEWVDAEVVEMAFDGTNAVEVEEEEGQPAAWLRATVTAVLEDGWFQALVRTPSDEAGWHDWFSWREEGTDWRRAAEPAAPSSQRGGAIEAAPAGPAPWSRAEEQHLSEAIRESMPAIHARFAAKEGGSTARSAEELMGRFVAAARWQRAEAAAR
ncbi:hypothetical protein EMIHUDRAFT_206065 [Emiliania huxleyi CCMP1516]|uniref:AP2/ERF domain-containing protein n=2 Tax=Emiliania huxleyi TaxID=2903 RepID=A0A0D3JQT0_EMIH1|nr:hypothetical protein EMIHUDRAFT_206065 [Emiliania huxleyi CCMP1516]EOD25865.1 hypothetical protein EMIHUDRAFT_206065 [Emiliania huxleyi CCMP1516]|eukprot:XP_005778294.1 hypothetical protein EMIHUDRAFT_206065 [Emiliania huxleyi CCMP1516]